MVIRWGKFGRFMACSGYPECKNTREIPKVCSLEPNGSSDEEEGLCEKCGRPMVLKRGRFGEFKACSGYPECRNTRKIAKGAEGAEHKPDVILEEICPVCGKNLAVKYGRYGEYTACCDYPKCKYLKLKTTGVACGKNCGGEIVERKSKRGKTFYGCSRYPECDFVLWNKPVSEACPTCKAPFTVVKTTKRTGTVRFCANEACDFKEKVEPAAVETPSSV
jgi:DNA topoisomerase I